MGRPAKNLYLPEKLKDLILSEKCVVFLGSGVSAGCYYSWPDLINKLCESCGSGTKVTADSPPDDFLDAAQNAKDCNEDQYYTFLGDHFGQSANKTNLFYNTLLTLPFMCCLTVNFDPLLARHAQTAKLNYELPPHAYPSLDRKNMTKRTIYYLHGMINEGETPAKGTIVLARKEFDEAYGKNSNLMNFLVPTLENENIVFLGCRLEEPVMPNVFAICKKHQLKRQQIIAEQGCTNSSPPPKRFILLPKPVVSDKDRKFDEKQSKITMEERDAYYKQMDIEPVWYVANGTDHSALCSEFENLAKLPSITPVHDWGGGFV